MPDPPYADIFSLERYLVQNVVDVRDADGVRVVTDPRQWAHALEFTPEASGDLADVPVVVTVSVDVESGEAEIGALSDTGTTFFSTALVGVGVHHVPLTIPTVRRCRGIVVRNAADTSSVVRVVRFDARPDDTAPHLVNGINLAIPYGTSRRGFWDKNIFADLVRLAGDVRVVFHVGAHEGEESALLLRLFPNATIHCFEPASPTFEILSRRLAGASRVRLHRVAVADRCGSVPFHINARAETSSLYPLVVGAEHILGRQAGGFAVEVPSTTIDDMMQLEAISTIDVLSVDAQGAELAILRGASETLSAGRIGVIATELTWAQLYEGQGAQHEVHAYLDHAGYALYDYYNFAHAESGDLLWGDALFLPRAR